MSEQSVDEAGGAFGLPVARTAPLRFALVFAGIAAVLFSLYYFPYQEMGISEGWATTYLERYAHGVGFVLRLADPGVVISNNTIVGRFSMSIVKSCDAMEANMLFCAALLAMPGVAWRKAAALIAGLAALVAVNVVRLCCLYYVGAYFGAWFEFAHIDLWPLLMIAFAVLDFVVCVRWVEPARRTRFASEGQANAET